MRSSSPWPAKYYTASATLFLQPTDVWKCNDFKTLMFRAFDEVCRHKERCSKETPVIKYGERAVGRYRGRVGTATNPASGAAIKVTDTNNYDDEIFTTVSVRKHAERGRSGDRGKAQDKSGVRKVGLLLSPS